MLKPWVGLISLISSSANLFNIDVLPALSKPRNKILTSLSDRLSLRNNDNKPFGFVY